MNVYSQTQHKFMNTIKDIDKIYIYNFQGPVEKILIQ